MHHAASYSNYTETGAPLSGWTSPHKPARATPKYMTDQWIISYEHHNVEEPAILLGGAFVVDIAEKERSGR